MVCVFLCGVLFVSFLEFILIARQDSGVSLISEELFFPKLKVEVRG